MQIYRHEALPYAGRDLFGSTCASLVRAGLERDERLLVLAERAKLDEVHDELGTTADEVTLVATDEHGRNPNRVTAVLHSFQAAGDGRTSTGVNEMAFAEDPSALRDETLLADFMLNSPSLQTWALSIVCLYDTLGLDTDLLHTMRQCHPVIRGEGENLDYLPDRVAEMYAADLAPASSVALRMTVRTGDLAAMRSFVREKGMALGAASARIDDLVLAVNEIVTNSLRHGGGTAEIAMWREASTVLCEVVDRGRIEDPMAGRYAPPPSASGGRGLWLANLLCDLVQVRSSARGTVVRMHVTG